MAACLAGFARQSAPPGSFEVVVVDDGSRTDLRPVVAPFRRSVPLVFLRRPHAGVSRARNAGIRKARGAWLVLHDDDLRPRPGFVRWCLDFHARRPAEEDAALLSFAPDRRVAKNLLVDWIFRTGRAYPFPRAAGVYSWHFFWSGALTCKKAVFRHGLFSPRYHALEDTELGLRLSRHVDLRVHFAPRVRSTYVRPLRFEEFFRRTYRMAYYTAVFGRQYPEIFVRREPAYLRPRQHLVRGRGALAAMVAAAARLEAALARTGGEDAQRSLLYRLWYQALDHALATGWMDGWGGRPATPPPLPDAVQTFG